MGNAENISSLVHIKFTHLFFENVKMRKKTFLGTVELQIELEILPLETHASGNNLLAHRTISTSSSVMMFFFVLIFYARCLKLWGVIWNFICFISSFFPQNLSSVLFPVDWMQSFPIRSLYESSGMGKLHVIILNLVMLRVIAKQLFFIAWNNFTALTFSHPNPWHRQRRDSQFLVFPLAASLTKLILEPKCNLQNAATKNLLTRRL